MLTYIRYVLTTICFTMSVVCLGLWGWSSLHENVLLGIQRRSPTHQITLDACGGCAKLYTAMESGIPKAGAPTSQWRFFRLQFKKTLDHYLAEERTRVFGASDNVIYFSLWFPALVFALAGVGALRLGRRFTLRSAIIATTVVAGLLGSVVAL